MIKSYNKLGQRNFVEDQIKWVIEQIRNVVKLIGLDPVEVEEKSIEIDVPLVDIQIAAILEGLKFEGLSNIRINNLEYNFIFSRLRLDVSLPEISLVVGNSALEVNFFDREFLGVFKGSLDIRSVRLAAEVYVNAGLEGISLRSLSINFSLGGIEFKSMDHPLILGTLRIIPAQLAVNMKLQLFALVLLVAGIYAFPSLENSYFDDEPSQRNPAEDRVRNMIERIIKRIQSAGVDPLNVEKREFSLDPPFLDIRLIGVIEKLHFSGLSDIRINHLEYSYIFNRLRIDVSIPEMKVSIGNSNFQGIIAGNAVKGELSGSLSINELRIQGVVYVDVNIIGQLYIRSISLDSSLKGIEADLKAMAQGVDRTEYVNNLFNVRIPAFLQNNKASNLQNIC
ncbi:hypothetical protein KGM_208762 [Danaus plexippus plexippus]|uniref:Uncharacterized protein n=1 Tax=Danaus plexippus plexippus TaxID=278856 RepID=A0A212EPW7_DANPL|nr:hypothetical protein KGM_208762 [Danaus plexippus plexippus]